MLAPGAAVFVTVIAFSLLGDGLRDILDPRTRRAFVRSTTPEPPAERALLPVTPIESSAGDPMAEGPLGTPDPGGGG